jgi:hypothetical protein
MYASDLWRKYRAKGRSIEGMTQELVVDG